MRGLGPFLKDAWRLARPYFRLRGEVVGASAAGRPSSALNLLLVGIDVMLNFWNGAFYDALQDKDWDSFISLLLTGTAHRQRLHAGVLRHRRGLYPGRGLPHLPEPVAADPLAALADRALPRRLAGRPRLLPHQPDAPTANGTGGTDNPDQRIAEDLRSFVADTLSLGIDLLSNVVSLFSFVSILWSLSGSMTSVRHHHSRATWSGSRCSMRCRAPGSPIWSAGPLAALNFSQQRYEANFRFALVRLRENVEGVALYQRRARGAAPASPPLRGGGRQLVADHAAHQDAERADRRLSAGRRWCSRSSSPRRAISAARSRSAG